MMGAGALAAVAVIGAGLVDYPMAGAEQQASADNGASAAGASAAGASAAATVVIERPIRYVRLKPGQKAPKGAKVIREAAPTPRVVVRRVVTSAPSQPTRTAARSRQSGG
jgi:hypothetical protein